MERQSWEGHVLTAPVRRGTETGEQQQLAEGGKRKWTGWGRKAAIEAELRGTCVPRYVEEGADFSGLGLGYRAMRFETLRHPKPKPQALRQDVLVVLLVPYTRAATLQQDMLLVPPSSH